MANSRHPGQRAAADLLAFYAEAGVDTAVGEEARNWLSPQDGAAPASLRTVPQAPSVISGGPARTSDLRMPSPAPRPAAPPAPDAAVMAAREVARTAADLDQLRAILD